VRESFYAHNNIPGAIWRAVTRYQARFFLQDMFDTMLASLKLDQLEMMATLQESFKEEMSDFYVKVKRDIRLENQELIDRFERQPKITSGTYRETQFRDRDFLIC
jgi:hypothetical protein